MFKQENKLNLYYIKTFELFSNNKYIRLMSDLLHFYL